MLHVKMQIDIFILCCFHILIVFFFSDTESGSIDAGPVWTGPPHHHHHNPDCPRSALNKHHHHQQQHEDLRSNLPDLVNHPSRSHNSTQLTVENVRHHEQLMKDHPKSNVDDPKVAKTGILKGGKLWKNGDGKKSRSFDEDIKDEEHTRRSVRFSGRDEYSMLEAVGVLDKIPLDAANQAALAKFLQPKLRELRDLLGEHHPQENWNLELSPVNNEIEHIESLEPNEKIHICEQHGVLGKQELDDEQISESMQRYEEMRRRVAIAEGRETPKDNNSVCSDESKSSSDSQSSDSTMTEAKIRRMENSDISNITGGILRSNNEVRRAIERNALRRSLTRFSDAKKKDTNRNDRSDKEESSLLEKLKWLTASEDATNGNTGDKNDEDKNNDSSDDEQSSQIQEVDPKVQETIATYRRLAEMFNKTTSLRGDVQVPVDVREWKIKSDLFPGQKPPANENDQDLPPGTSTFTAVPAVSICEHFDEEENDKLIYSGGVRYTREGTLPFPRPNDQSNDGDNQYSEEKSNHQTNATEVRKQFLAQPSNQSFSGEPRDRSSIISNPDSYSLDDIDEALHDDRSSSVPSSSQSSPRLSGRSDMDGTSTTESGYSSNETNGDLYPVPPVDMDELAEFVRQDAGRMERLRRRYDESEDHGFYRRPSVRGIKPRFGSTTDLLKQMANQLAPPPMVQQTVSGSHMTWPYRDGSEEETSSTAPAPRRRPPPVRSNTLPALQEDAPFIAPSDMPIVVSSNMGSHSTNTTLIHSKSPRVVHMYASTGDLQVPFRPNAPLETSGSQISGSREPLPPDLIQRSLSGSYPTRTQSYSTLPQSTQFGSVQTLAMHPQGTNSSAHDMHLNACPIRRPASVHGHLPPDSVVSRPIHPTNSLPRPHSTMSNYPPPHQYNSQHFHVNEEPARPTSENTNTHAPLGPRGSFPGAVPSHLSQQLEGSRLSASSNTNMNFVSYNTNTSQPIHYHGNVQQSHSHSGSLQHSHLGSHQHSHSGSLQHSHSGSLQHSHSNLGPVQHSHSHIGLVQHTHPHGGSGQHSHIHTGPAQRSHSHLICPPPPPPQAHIGCPPPPPSSHSVGQPPPYSSMKPPHPGYIRTQHIHNNPTDKASPVGPGPPQIGSMRQIQQHRMLPMPNIEDHSYLPPPPQWAHGHSCLSNPVSSELAYTTPMVPEGPGHMMNGILSKLEGGVRDERGVPEGASSSPRGLEVQYSPQGSPTREHGGMLVRHAQPINMIT